MSAVENWRAVPVTFNLDAMCRTARRRLRKTIDAAVGRDLAAIAADFQRARRVRGLPPIVLLAWKVYTLPHPRYSCPECDGRVCFEVDEWSTSTGMPTVGGIRVMCVAEEQEFDRAMQADEDPAWKHQHWQDPGWMGLHRRVERFCASNVRVPLCDLAIKTDESGASITVDAMHPDGPLTVGCPTPDTVIGVVETEPGTFRFIASRASNIQ